MNRVINEELQKYSDLFNVIRKLPRTDRAATLRTLKTLETAGISPLDFLWFEERLDLIRFMDGLGFFRDDGTPETGKKLREIEKQIVDKNLRGFLRSMRLNTTKFSRKFGCKKCAKKRELPEGVRDIFWG